jgi:hypothetical protein
MHKNICIFQTEVCDDTYTKNCHISFLEETTPVDVGVCYTEASRVCDKEDLQKRKRSMGDFEFEVKETCMEVLETGKYKAPNAINLT